VFAWPSGKGAQPAPDYWFWLFGIPASSKNKEAAALFTAWATSPEVELDVGRQTGSPVARASVWTDADFKKFYPGEMADEIAKNLTNVQAARVPYGNPRFPNAADALSVELVNVLTGSKDPAAAMKAAQAAMDEAMQ
jgi:ABC-type glycerol-3-phosphate transport system substrate-binding protein